MKNKLCILLLLSTIKSVCLYGQYDHPNGTDSTEMVKPDSSAVLVYLDNLDTVASSPNVRLINLEPNDGIIGVSNIVNPCSP